MVVEGHNEASHSEPIQTQTTVSSSSTLLDNNEIRRREEYDEDNEEVYIARDSDVIRDEEKWLEGVSNPRSAHLDPYLFICYFKMF